MDYNTFRRTGWGLIKQSPLVYDCYDTFTNGTMWLFAKQISDPETVYRYELQTGDQVQGSHHFSSLNSPMAPSGFTVEHYISKNTGHESLTDWLRDNEYPVKDLVQEIGNVVHPV